MNEDVPEKSNIKPTEIDANQALVYLIQGMLENQPALWTFTGKLDGPLLIANYKLLDYNVKLVLVNGGEVRKYDPITFEPRGLKSEIVFSLNNGRSRCYLTNDQVTQIKNSIIIQ